MLQKDLSKQVVFVLNSVRNQTLGIILQGGTSKKSLEIPVAVEKAISELADQKGMAVCMLRRSHGNTRLHFRFDSDDNGTGKHWKVNACSVCCKFSAKPVSDSASLCNIPPMF